MEFKQLRSFIEVVHRGGFTQAGKTLHISQSAVSKQVAQLEQSLGTPLLDRIGSQVRLTAAGQVVLQRAEAMLRLQTELLSELDDLNQLTRGELRMGLPQLGATPCLPGCLPNIAGATPMSASNCSRAAAAILSRQSSRVSWTSAAACCPPIRLSPGKLSVMNRWMRCCPWTTHWRSTQRLAWRSWPTRHF